MTAVRVAARSAAVQYEDVPLAGDVAQMLNVLENHRRSGRLVGHTPARSLPDGRVYLVIRLLPEPSAVSQPRVDPRVYKILAVIGGVLAVVALVVWAVYLLIQALIAVFQILLGGAVLVAIAWFVLGRAGVCCPGLHCPGCRH